jgi:hypothetical protein
VLSWSFAIVAVLVIIVVVGLYEVKMRIKRVSLENELRRLSGGGVKSSIKVENL